MSTAPAWAPDLIVLYVMLPGLDGHEVCRRVQADRPVPVLMLTARDDETDVLVGLGVGADDHLTKPFSMRELVARVRVLLRRVERAAELAARPPEELVVGDLRIDHTQRRVHHRGSAIHLIPIEFDLLVCLAAQPGAVLSREQLLSEVWDWQDAAGTRTVDSHVKSSRSKLGADLVRTVFERFTTGVHAPGEGTAAPVSAWQSPAGPRTCTGGRSWWPTLPAAATSGSPSPGQEHRMSNPAIAAPMPPRPILDAVFGHLWPDPHTAGRPPPGRLRARRRGARVPGHPVP